MLSDETSEFDFNLTLSPKAKAWFVGQYSYLQDCLSTERADGIAVKSQNFHILHAFKGLSQFFGSLFRDLVLSEMQFFQSVLQCQHDLAYARNAVIADQVLGKVQVNHQRPVLKKQRKKSGHTKRNEFKPSFRSAIRTYTQQKTSDLHASQ